MIIISVLFYDKNYYFLKLYNVDVEYLPYEFNMCDMNRVEILNDDLLFTKCGWVYHYNAISNNENSSRMHYFMKKTYNYLYNN